MYWGFFHEVFVPVGTMIVLTSCGIGFAYSMWKIS